MTLVIKIVLSILLLICLLDMPYGYYQLVRLLALVGFGYLAYQAKKENNDNEMFIYGGLALLFQPFLKIPLGRGLWNIVDVVVGVGLLVSVFKKPKRY
ncbi:hypothetical protein MMU07_08760 [Aquiflexum sp. LQ15W]|uniref:DUF6804 family protein n=1 Tax=Cognataquiflexum nitidum TaxID=2922272 RepID=UPI001F1443FB|nr:DUF6804 family protein [Cognataquiflexum nitidum]MCH6199668.1 hypothetical protein [Cognataquiflexum nitidum]